MRHLFRRLYFALRPSHRLMVMDYPIEPKPVYTEDHPHRKLEEIISVNDSDYGMLLRKALTFKEAFFAINEASHEKDPALPAWNNNYVPGLDIIMLYTMLTELRPKKFIEIGSGTTTKTAYKARSEQGLNFSITCIDPSPRQ